MRFLLCFKLVSECFQTTFSFQHPCDGIKCADHEICIADRRGPCLETITRDGDIIQCPQHQCGKKSDKLRFIFNFASVSLSYWFIKHAQYSTLMGQSEETCCDLYQSHLRKKTETNCKLTYARFPSLGRHRCYFSRA